MTITHELSECTDMTEEKFKECLGRIDMKAFMENPTQALIDAGITLKKGISFKFVETEEAANSLPENVFPLIRTKKNNEELVLDDLDKIAGGNYGFNRITDGIGMGLSFASIMAARDANKNK